ncbi:MAG: ribosome silencing factor [Muribaculaceae bacterium]|nr:ribosome silencing factor [Muribaculaceae bacterium]MBR5118106.1 ribosome silencing factor [Muribaculaceae bacterium]
MTETSELIKNIIEGIQEKKGRDIMHIDLTKLEYATATAFVIATGNTKIQVEAIADSVREYVQEKTGQKPYNYDGYQNSQWIVIDYGTVFAHIFLPEERQRYNLEELWADANLMQIPNLD